VEAARYKRKIMGGGMRQAGILAAAGIIALTEQTRRLGEDHDRAKRLARGLGVIPGIVIKPEEVDINMVFFSFSPARDAGIAKGIVDFFAKRGIVVSPPDQGVFRFVTHYWIGDSEVAAILETSREAFV
jgi:threonine aldolase